MNALSCRLGVLCLLAMIQSADCNMRADELVIPSGEPRKSLKETLESIRSKYELPAVWACKYNAGSIVVSAADGTHKVDDERNVELDNLIHLGSCTKAMTAVMIAQLVSAGELDWDTSLKDVFGSNQKLAGSLWAQVTVEDLLRHRSGAPANCDWLQIDLHNAADPIAGRRAVLEWLSQQKYPLRKSFLYSNVGYCLLGHMLEEIKGETWESLIEAQLFQPLQIEHAGFGPVKPTKITNENGTVEIKEQPWGHVRKPKSPAELLGEGLSTLLGGKPANPLTPVRLDNALPLGPAGRVHMPILEWAKFVQLFSTPAAPDKLKIDEETWERLLDPGKEGQYAGGWNRLQRQWAGGDALFHNGSNTSWYCVAWVAPENGMFCLVATNCYEASAMRACDEVATALIMNKY